MLSTSTLSFRGLAMALALVAGVAVVSDASAMSRKDKRTLVGAVVGGVAGNLLSNGDPAATVGESVAGGAIGNLTTFRPPRPPLLRQSPLRRPLRSPLRPWLPQWLRPWR